MKDFSKLGKKDFEEILRGYKIGSYISHSYYSWVLENYVYKLITTKGIYILKILRNANLNQFRKQLEFIDFLETKKIPVAKNFRDKKGRELIPYNKKYFVIQEFIEGKSMKKIGGDLSKEMGKQIGKMHKLLLQSKWKTKDKHHVYKEKNLKNVRENTSLQKVYDSLKEKLNSFDKVGWKAAYIHSDLTEVNLLVEKDQLKAIIDFDDSDYDYLIYDIAIFIAHAYIAKKSIQKKKIKIFLKEYQRYIKLGDREKEGLYYLIYYRLFGILYWYVLHLKSHPEHKATMQKGIKRNVQVLEKFEKFKLKDFMKILE